MDGACRSHPRSGKTFAIENKGYQTGNRRSTATPSIFPCSIKYSATLIACSHTIEKITHAPARKMAAPPPHQLSRKLLRILDRLGCFSFLSAFASIWRMRSREVCGHRVAARGMRAAADDTGGRVLQRLAEVLTTQVDSPAKCQDKRGWGLARISSPRLPQRDARRGLWSRHQRVMAPSAVANPSLSSAARTTLRHSKSTAARRRANG